MRGSYIQHTPQLVFQVLVLRVALFYTLSPLFSQCIFQIRGGQPCWQERRYVLRLLQKISLVVVGACKTNNQLEHTNIAGSTRWIASTSLPLYRHCRWRCLFIRHLHIASWYLWRSFVECELVRTNLVDLFYVSKGC